MTGLGRKASVAGVRTGQHQQGGQRLPAGRSLVTGALVNESWHPHFMPRAQPGEVRKTADELRREIEADRPGDAWCGDSPEREWATVIAYYVKAKLPKTLAEGFLRYSVNWLIVYDGWPLPVVNYDKAASYLSPLLAAMDAFSVFDAIFVHDGSRMCEFHEAWIIHPLVKPARRLTQVSFDMPFRQR